MYNWETIDGSTIIHLCGRSLDYGLGGCGLTTQPNLLLILWRIIGCVSSGK